jgi:GH25 family lysozyme M1 (1,4-beta-N-acetylmuramidase)
MLKKLFRTLPVLAVCVLIFGSTVYAQDNESVEVIPMEELNIGEDPLGLEDGERYKSEEYGKEDTDIYYSYEYFRTYLSSGVSNVAYEACEVQGVDVSKWQGSIDWPLAIRSSGIKFAIIRVGYRGTEGGTICADPYAEQNIQNALAAGLKVGVYFFSQAINEQEALEEASYTLGIIKKYNITYPVVFDWETSAGYRTYDAGIAGARMDAIASKFCDTVSNAGYIPMVYSNKADFTNRFNYSNMASKYYIWYARYVNLYGPARCYQSGDPLPTEFPFHIWQYQSDGCITGIGNNVDRNVSFLDFGNYKDREITVSAGDSRVVIDQSALTITGLPAGSTAATAASAFPAFIVTVNGQTTSTQTLLKTGDVLKFKSKYPDTYLTKDTYTFYIKGDVNGTGTVDVSDMEQIQKYILGLGTLDGVYYKAALVSGNTGLSVTDMEKIQKSILGLEALE